MKHQIPEAEDELSLLAVTPPGYHYICNFSSDLALVIQQAISFWAHTSI